MLKNTNGFGHIFSDSKYVFWMSLLLVIFIFLHLFSGICFSFFAGFILAYLCVPLVNWLSVYINRSLLSLIMTFCFVCVFLLIGINLVPIVSDYLSRMSDNLPEYYQKFLDLCSQLWQSFGYTQPPEGFSNIKREILSYSDRSIYFATSILKSIAQQCTAITGFISFFVIMTLSFFYFLKDWNEITSCFCNYIPTAHRKIVTQISHMTRKSFLDFFQGQFFVVIILSVYYAGFLSFTVVDHFLGLGIMSGLFSFIPFIGAIISLLIVVFLNVTTLSLQSLYAILTIYLVGQIFEGYVLSPKFVGKKTGLHPLWILFSFFAGFHLNGVIGVLVAIPFAAIVLNLVRFALEKFKHGQAYKL